MIQTHYKSNRLPGVGKEGWAYFSVKRPRRAIVFIHGWNGSAVDAWMQFQAMLQGHPDTADIDLFFFGYYSWRRTVEASAVSLGRFLKMLATSPQDLDGWPDQRPKGSAYQEFILVAHSMGALVARLCLLDAYEDKARWANSSKLVLFAPAHFGGNPIRLIPKSITAPVEVLWPTLRALSSKSDLIVNLQKNVAKALKTGNADFLRAVKVVHGGADTVVDFPRKRFCGDVKADWIDDAGHIRVCKPQREFQAPLERLLEAL